MGDSRKMSGFFSQIKIISWKNLLLYLQNKSGLICEIVFSCLFLLIFVVLTYYDVVVYREPVTVRPQTPSLNPFDISVSSNMIDVYFYPDSPFVRRVVTDAFSNWKWLNLIGYNKNDIDSLSDDALSQTLVFLSFNFNSSNNIPDTIEYVIRSLE
jgi:hypothetical protein